MLAKVVPVMAYGLDKGARLSEPWFPRFLLAGVRQYEDGLEEVVVRGSQSATADAVVHADLAGFPPRRSGWMRPRSEWCSSWWSCICIVWAVVMVLAPRIVRTCIVLALAISVHPDVLVGADLLGAAGMFARVVPLMACGHRDKGARLWAV